MTLLPSPQRKTAASPPWAETTELVGIRLQLQPHKPCILYPQYAIGLHAWFLDQVRQHNPTLSAILHDDQSEKAFTLSDLGVSSSSTERGLQLQPDRSYDWTITALSPAVAQWLAQWLQILPPTVELRNAPLRIQQVAIVHAPTTYAQLWKLNQTGENRVALSFTAPTSFRRHGQHFPLPVPFNVFHSYLRRWNAFSHTPFDQDEFLDWVDEAILVLRYSLESTKVLAGKKGSVTAFTGAIEFGVSPKAAFNPAFEQLFFTLASVAPYCGTGHKTTFGLGQTRLGWLLPNSMSAQVPTAAPSIDVLLADRVAELTQTFTALRQRTGGDRASKVAETWATILARRELGDSLLNIAADLEMPYETVKTYAKLARRMLKTHELPQ